MANEKTSKKGAKRAEKFWAKPKPPAAVKSVAASALTQAPSKKKTVATKKGK